MRCFRKKRRLKLQRPGRSCAGHCRAIRKLWSLKDGDLESEEEHLGRMNNEEGDKTTHTVL